jgi:hypothetical protein
MVEDGDGKTTDRMCIYRVSLARLVSDKIYAQSLASRRLMIPAACIGRGRWRSQHVPAQFDCRRARPTDVDGPKL